MRTTVHNDAIGGRLAEAMMLMEMSLDGGFQLNGKLVPSCDLVAAAHSFVQAACSAYTGSATPVSNEAAELSAAIHAAAAIEEAKATE